MPKRRSTELNQLRTLAADPSEQARFAVKLLQPRLGNEVILAGLQVLERASASAPVTAARPALLQLYAFYEQKSRRHDPAAILRATILRALRPLVVLDDVPFLAQAVATFVFPPPAFKEEGALLRSAALNALSEIEGTLARFHAVRLLANEHTDPMSGEPALSAARLLAAYDELLPLYFYVMQDSTRTMPEVLSECLRQLTNLPAEMLVTVSERYAEHADDVVLVGLFELLLHHRSGPHQLDLMRTFLRTTGRLEVYRYLATVLLTAGRDELLAELLTVAQDEHNPQRLAVLADVLTLLADAPAVRPVLETVLRRVKQTSAAWR